MNPSKIFRRVPPASPRATRLILITAHEDGIPLHIVLAADQAPESADILKSGHEGSDFLFIRVGR